MGASTLITDYVGRGLAAARPTTPNVPSGATAFYYATDTSTLSQWTGSAWSTVGGGGGGGGSGLFSGLITAPPTIASATWTNVNITGTNTSVADSAAGVVIRAGTATGETHGIRIAAPATPYTRTALIMTPPMGGSFMYPGLFASDGTKFQRFGQVTGASFGVQNWSTYNGFSGNVVTLGTEYQTTPYLWLRVADDGTNFSYLASSDGVNFWTVYKVAKASGYLGATGYSFIGVFLGVQVAGLAVTDGFPLTLASWA